MPRSDILLDQLVELINQHGGGDALGRKRLPARVVRRIIAHVLILGGAGHRVHIRFITQRLEVTDAENRVNPISGLLLPAQDRLNHQVLMAMDVTEDGYGFGHT